jgi:hypothetical protein
MKIANVVFITLVVNCILLPFYTLIVFDFKSVVDMAEIGLKNMFFPTCCIALTYILVHKAYANKPLHSIVKLILTMLTLLIVNLILQFIWSYVVSSDPVRHFISFWGFYFIWTALSCILIPLLNKFYKSHRKRTAHSN